MSTLPRAPVPFLHLIDGDGAIASPRTVAAYLTKVIGAEESKIPALTSNARGAPSIAALRERGCNYRVVGVFGGQSTGKSTLLNLLFGTRFDVMNADEGRTQTTKGCFLGKGLVDTSASGGGELFVMDFEGTDGAERGENQSFEKQLSLFALSVADTLIVNMFVQEVGRFNAANLSLLQTVFEVNLQLLSHESARPTAEAKPTLLFVLRDHVDGPVQKLREGIVKSLDGIWSRIGKPESFAQTTFNDFFNLSFCALPHYKLQRPQFDDAVDDLRRWFSDPRCPSFLYAGVGPDNYRHIPLDDVADYLANCWHSIQTVKDLDIPTQREMLALVRCQEVSEALAAEHEADMKKRLARLKEGVFIPNITGWIRAVIRQRLAAFATETGHYAKTVTKNATSELQRRLELTSEPLLDAQCKRLCDALVRASGDRVQAVMDLAFNSVLPRLATEWYSKIENARSAAASAAKNDDEVTRNTKIAEAQRRVKVSASVKKFWDFVAAELQSVQDLLQTQINSTASGSSTGGTTSGRGTPVDAESRSATPIDARDEPSAALTKLLQCLRGDSDAVQRTLDLVQLTLHKQVVERLQFVSSDLSSSMTKVFDQHLAKNSDGTVRFLTTAKGLQKAFGPARAAGLLLAACCAVYRLNDASHDESLQDPAIATLVDRWSADAMHLDFAIDENSVNLIGAPVYPTLPTPPALNKLRVVSRDEDDDSATAQTTQDTTSTTGAAALRLFATRIVVDESRLSRAFELYQQQCSFTYTMQMKQIEAGTSTTPVWMWALVLLLGANEIWWLLTNPLMLIFLAAAVWFFFRNWVEAQWHKFEETGPAQLVIPAQAAVSYMGHAYATHVAPRLGGAAAAPRKTKAE